MRRSIRILVNAATVAALFVCVATVVLWVRSYRVGEWFGYAHVDPPGRDRAVDWSFYVSSGNGRMALVHHRDVYDDPAVSAYLRRGIQGGGWFGNRGTVGPSAYMARNVPRVLGIGIGTRHDVATYGHNENWIVTAPHVMWALPAAVVAAVGVGRWWRDRALRRPGHCRACGYDLRATPGRCPECGTVPVG
jgi:hypothetical protein